MTDLFKRRLAAYRYIARQNRVERNHSDRYILGPCNLCVDPYKVTLTLRRNGHPWNTMLLSFDQGAGSNTLFVSRLFVSVYHVAAILGYHTEQQNEAR
jgi:hypothetical protein